EVDGVVHVPRKAGDDVRARVVREERSARSGGAEHVHDVVDRLHDVAVADAQALIGRFKRELVAATRIALLVMVQALKARAELWVRLRLFRGRRDEAAFATARERAIDGPVEGLRAGLVFWVDEFEVGPVPGWRELTGYR